MRIYTGDCLEVLKTLPDNSIDALITDPPAGISFMGKNWDSDLGGRLHWIGWLTLVLIECKRVMKPGAHGLVWALDKTAHWTATACEEAGFGVRHKIYHAFGSGFPKAHVFNKDKDPEVCQAGFSGWGTGGLKPAVEEWILIRKPLEKEPEYVKIAEKRIEYAEKKMGVTV